MILFSPSPPVSLTFLMTHGGWPPRKLTSESSKDQIRTARPKQDTRPDTTSGEVFNYISWSGSATWVYVLPTYQRKRYFYRYPLRSQVLKLEDRQREHSFSQSSNFPSKFNNSDLFLPVLPTDEAYLPPRVPNRFPRDRF